LNILQDLVLGNLLSIGIFLSVSIDQDSCASGTIVITLLLDWTSNIFELAYLLRLA
jgi:hypothetical protein